MALKKLNKEDIITNNIVYVTVAELCAETGTSKSTLHQHIQEDIIDGYTFKSKTFITPDDAEKYKRLREAGVLGRVKR